VSRIQFAAQVVGSAKVNGKNERVYTIGHLELADSVGSPTDPDDSDSEAASDNDDDQD
jgi:hypothetical protein